MTTALMTRPPLRMSTSMTDGHDEVDETTRVLDGLPLGYLYAEWRSMDVPDEATNEGHYDPDAQTWVFPAGVPTAGVATWTRTSGSKCGDCVQDDACF